MSIPKRAKTEFWRVSSYGKRKKATEIYMGRAALRACGSAVKIFGGYGYMREYPVERCVT